MSRLKTAHSFWFTRCDTPLVTSCKAMICGAERMRKAGYREGASELAHPHRKRRYFFDTEDTEWEFVEYLSDDPAQRNDYSV